MYYVDTSVLISYVFASDIGHDVSRRILENVAARGQKLYASSFTLVEMCNVVCRKIVKEKKLRLIEPLQSYVDVHGSEEDRCRFLLSLIISFLKERLGIEFVDDENLYEFESIDLNELRIPRIFRETILLSQKIPLRIKDLLHVAYASALSRTRNVKYFLTRDVEDFEKVKDEVKRLLQIEVVFVE